MDGKSMCLLIGAALLLFILVAFSRLKNDINRNYSILTKIAKKVGVPKPSADDEIKTLIAEGNKIKAIKRYREITGAGLKEANDYIDKLMG